MTTFPLKGKSEMVVSRGIPVQSLCAHHLLPFVGEATVAYIPLNKVLGLSKLSRAVEYMARRPQVQEELTTGIADFLLETLVEPRLPEVEMEGWGVGVVIRAKHFCVELRGAKHSSDMVTSALRGEFLKPEVRAEFLSLAGVM
jgi:GTP cyclohydrolase I